MSVFEELERFFQLNKIGIDSLEEECKQLREEIERTKDFSSPEYIKVTKQLKETERKKDLIKKLNDLKLEIQDLHEIKKDATLQEQAAQEIKEKEKDLQSNFGYLKEFYTLELDNDSDEAIVEIRPGVGGVEASLFAEELFRAYTRFCNSNGLNPEVIAIDYSAEGGIKEASFIAHGKAYALLRFESGVHRIQRVPKTESAGRLHTSSSSVTVLPKIKHSNVKIKDSDIKIDVYRSSGPGGQSVNTTDSAVRMTHIPTGIMVTCQQEKSQQKNKKQALSILQSKLEEKKQNEKAKQHQDIRTAAIQSGDRSVKIRTYNVPQSRITDHRININWFNLQEALNQDIGSIIKETNKAIRAIIAEEKNA